MWLQAAMLPRDVPSPIFGWGRRGARPALCRTALCGVIVSWESYRECMC